VLVQGEEGMREEWRRGGGEEVQCTAVKDCLCIVAKWLSNI